MKDEIQRFWTFRRKISTQCSGLRQVHYIHRRNLFTDLITKNKKQNKKTPSLLWSVLLYLNKMHRSPHDMNRAPHNHLVCSQAHLLGRAPHNQIISTQAQPLGRIPYNHVVRSQAQLLSRAPHNHIVGSQAQPLGRALINMSSNRRKDLARSPW